MGRIGRPGITSTKGKERFGDKIVAVSIPLGLRGSST